MKSPLRLRVWPAASCRAPATSASWRIWSGWWTAPQPNSAEIDIVVNNAATNIAQGPAIEMDDGQFDKMVEVNLKSAYRLTRLVAPGMVAARLGVDHQHRLHRRAAPAVPRPAVQHDQSRAHHDDAILRGGAGPVGRARERHRARADPDGAERILLEGREHAGSRCWRASRSSTWASRSKWPRSRCCWRAMRRPT